MQKTNLTIIYRAYPKISKTPILPFTTKDELISFSLSSLADAIESIKPKFIFLSDNCTPAQKDIVTSTMGPVTHSLITIDLDGIGNQLSFLRQLNEASNADTEFVLLLEDDYYIAEEDMNLLMKSLLSPKVDYATLYFPEDAETSVGGMARSTTKLGSDLCATILPSTTLTFASRTKTLNSDVEHFKEFSRGGDDCSIWLRLTSNFTWFLTRITFPLFRNNPRLYMHIVWRYIRHMLRHKRKKRTLVHVGTAISTHLEAPGVLRRFNLPIILAQRYTEFQNSRVS